MITVALYNAKGGVGKTAACVNLAFLAASEGRKTVLWDLDSQASSTFYFRGEQKKKGRVKKLAVGAKKRIDSFVRETRFENLSLVPSDFSARKLDLLFHDTKKPKKQLLGFTKVLAGSFELLLLDAPPGFNLLAENVIRAVDFLLLPMIPTTLSVRAFLQIVRYMENRRLDLDKLLPFFSMVDLRKKIHRETVHAYTGVENRFLRNCIPYSSDVERMGLACAPVFTYAPHSRAAEAYQCLWDEIKGRLYPALR
jgi:chromosome partitioning protein